MTGQQSVAELAATMITSGIATDPAAGGLTYPGDVYDLLAELTLLAGRLPQLLAQAEAWLETECEAGRLRVGAGAFTDDPVAAVTATGVWLDQSAAAAGRLRHALDQAQHGLAHLAHT